MNQDGFSSSFDGPEALKGNVSADYVAAQAEAGVSTIATAAAAVATATFDTSAGSSSLRYKHEGHLAENEQRSEVVKWDNVERKSGGVNVESIGTPSDEEGHSGGGGGDGVPSATTSTATRTASSRAAEQAREGRSSDDKGCNCKNSKCLKLYCECFAKGHSCGAHCNCRNCHNDDKHSDLKQQAIEAILDRNPNAFQPKVKRKTSEGNYIGAVADREQHNKGCNCRKSGCLKRYCECFQAGVLCSDLCKCVNCRNFDGCPDVAEARNGMRRASGSTSDRAAFQVKRRATLLAPAPVRRVEGELLGKRPVAEKPPREPSAKRMLFSKESVLKSKIEDIGMPGGLHYEAGKYEEESPEQVLSAARDVIGESVLSEMEKDTTMLMQIFVQESDASRDKRRPAGRSDDSVSGKGIGNAKDEDVKTGDGKSTISLLCEEEGIDEDVSYSVGAQPLWFKEAEKKILEQCARTLYVISGARTSNRTVNVSSTNRFRNGSHVSSRPIE